MALHNATTRYFGANSGGMGNQNWLAFTKPFTNMMWMLHDGQTDLLYAYIAGRLYR